MSDAADETRASPFDFRIKREGSAPRPQVRLCEHNGCMEAGDYRAPRSRENLREYRWLCLAHVREANERWNYFAGMDDGQVAAFQRDAVTGHRPTWKLKDRAASPYTVHADRKSWRERVRDAYSVFEDGTTAEVKVEARGAHSPVRTRMQIEALVQLGLDGAATLPDVKARYKELVKRYHPDANGGDRSAEERLTVVIRAYALLKKSNFS